MFIIQLLPSLHFGDAVGNDALAISTLLKKMGYDSKIFAEYIGNGISSDIAAKYTSIPALCEDDLIIYHFSTGSDIMEEILRDKKCRKIMIYHNITPSNFFENYDAKLTQLVKKGRKSLRRLNKTFECCIADSEFNKKDLIASGFTCPIDVMPVLIPLEDYNKKPNEDIINKYKNDGWVNLLFVGRIAPNKKQEDVIRCFSYYKKHINPKSRLFIVGNHVGMDKYYDRLCKYIKSAQVPDVFLTGPTPFDQILAYYKIANVFLCMSEHEGFCVPLVEAMKFDVPIVAYASTAIPETLGGAGVLLDQKNSILASKLIDRIITDKALRSKIVNRQRERLNFFSYEKTANNFSIKIQSLIQNEIVPTNNKNNNVCLDNSDVVIKEMICNCKKEIERDDLKDDSPLFQDIPFADDNSFKNKVKIKVLKPIYHQLYKLCPGLADSMRTTIYRLAGKKNVVSNNISTTNCLQERIFVDVSIVSVTEVATGIQRVVNSVAKELVKLINLQNLEFVQICSSNLLVCNSYFNKLKVGHSQNESYLTVGNKEKLLLLDSSWDRAMWAKHIIKKVHQSGGKVYGVVYDLFPIQYRDLFESQQMIDVFTEWHNLLLRSCDGVLCISRTTADMVTKYYKKAELTRSKPLNVFFFDMGADFPSFTGDMPVKKSIKEFVTHGITFLTVGTVEPRKGYAVVAEAFKNIECEKNIQWLIVGRNGWKNNEFLRCLNNDKLLKTSMWVENATDEDLRWCYEHSAALIAASQDEGFGLPIIEAAHYGLPIICSDIPIFHEVAQDNVTYFKVMDSVSLQEVIEKWLSEDKHPDSKNIKIHTWKESAQEILDIMNDKVKPYKILQ